MSKVDDELTRRIRRAERPVGDDGLFEGLARRRSHRERLRRVQAGMLALAVLAATAGGFVVLREAFGENTRDVGESPVLAGNGEIVFSREGADGRFHLYAVQPDGSGLRQITQDATNDTDPTVSPGGETVAYVHELDQGIRVIATVPIDGGIVAWHTPEAMEASDPVWSSNGESIAFVGWAEQSVPPGFEAPQRYRAIFTVDATDGSPERLTDGGISFTSDPTWSPGDRSIAFAGGSCTPGCEGAIQNDLLIVDVSTTDGRRLTPYSPDIDEEAPAWSPDGTRIAFIRPGDEGDEVWIVTTDGGSEQLVATAVEASLEPDLTWAPDGSALLVSDGDWIYRVDATPEGDLRDNFVQLVEGHAPAWQPLPVGAAPSVTTSPEPSVSPSPSPSPEPEGLDVGLGFNLCDIRRLDGIDFLGDGTMGTAWTGNETTPDGVCPGIDDDRYGVAVDFTGDGIADSWSGETIEHCTGCEPFKATDLNVDGKEDLIVTVSYFSIMQYGLYTVMPVDGELEIVPFRTGEPGHPQHGLDAGKPFTFWVGGDAGSSDWFYCQRLPGFWLTGTESPIDGGPGDVTTWHETHVSLGTDGIAHILDARTYTVPYGTLIDHEHTTSKPDCGLGVDIWR
jgi:hypothetical protein